MSDLAPVSGNTNRGTDISGEQKQLFTIVNHVFLCGLIGLFGIISNSMNLVTFYKQGLDTTINISFFAMSVSDLWSLIFQMWFLLCDVPYFEQINLPMVYADVQHLVGGITREMFARITCLITAYVTAERCLCIAFPLHVKQMITPRRTTVIIFMFFLLTWSYGLPLFVIAYLDWQFYPDKNRTLLGSVFAHNKDSVEGAVFITHGIVGVVSMVAVVVLTLVLIRKLGQTSAWRRAMKTDQDKSDPTTKRDRATMSMVVLIAIILIVCYMPAVALSVTTFCEPEFGVGGKFVNLFLVSWSFALVFETINSSVNIFFYYKMSTRFRQIFRDTFFSCPSSAPNE